MANNISVFKKYIDLLDEVYKNASLTSVLDGDSTLTSVGANANELIIPKIDMDGLANYDRNGGYVDGSVTLTNETVKFNYDRGRAFSVDAMDNEETAGLAFGKLSSEFIRTKTVPEMDAFRFATYASATGAVKDAGALADGAAVIAALRKGINRMDEEEVPCDGRYLFITPAVYGMVLDLDETKSKAVLSRFEDIILVPQSRFYTAVELLSGGSDQTAGGFKKGAAAKEIDFMIVHKDAVIQYPKHTVNKVIRPEENQKADAWRFFFRAYGLVNVYENKAKGIFVHTKA